MSEAKHTPGPWVYEAGTKTIRSKPANYWLATMNSWDGAVNNEANARLIAAAPETAAERDKLKAVNAELLTALQAVIERFQIEIDILTDGSFGDVNFPEVRAARTAIRAALPKAGS